MLICNYKLSLVYLLTLLLSFVRGSIWRFSWSDKENERMRHRYRWSIFRETSEYILSRSEDCGFCPPIMHWKHIRGSVYSKQQLHLKEAYLCQIGPLYVKILPLFQFFEILWYYSKYGQIQWKSLPFDRLSLFRYSVKQALLLCKMT